MKPQNILLQSPISEEALALIKGIIALDNRKLSKHRGRPKGSKNRRKK